MSNLLRQLRGGVGGIDGDVDPVEIDGQRITRWTKEFWTPKQRQAAAIHEVSYRACFKPQLPRFFIEQLTKTNELVYDPFSGRGTTLIEAGLLGRAVVANDINPISKILALPRLLAPAVSEVEKRLSEIPIYKQARADIDLSMFYHRDTEAEIVSVRNYLVARASENYEDDLDRWIRMVATNRLTGHSIGFFSAYTLPPNQAVSPESQQKINAKLNQVPLYRNTKKIILNKTKSLLRGLTETQHLNLRHAAHGAVYLTNQAHATPEIASGSVALTVTSPPFLNIVQYAKDNWLRAWFNNIDVQSVASKITMSKTLAEWTHAMHQVFAELYRVTKPAGFVAFEVGELRNGKLKLDEPVVPIGIQAGFACEGILINAQTFTKTSNIWGVKNNSSGTNTNRIVLFRKD